MSICLFPNLAYLSETSRAVEIYRALRELGESPLVAAHGGTYEFILQEERIPYHIVPPVMTAKRCRDFVLANIGKKANFYTVPELREHVTEEVAFFKKHDVRIVHIGFTLSAKLSTRVLGLPLSTAHGSFFPPVFAKKLVPYRKDFNRGPIRLLPESWKRNFANWLFSHARLYTRPFNKVAKEFNLKPVQSIADLFLGDYAFVTDIPEIIGISKEEMESWENVRDRRYSDRIKLIHAGPIYARLFGELTEDIREFLNTDQPKIFVALTSSVEDCLSSVYKTLKDFDGRIIFVTTTHPRDFQPAPNIIIKDHVPSHKIMPLCDVAIIHGGQGSVQTAIASGTPIIGFPLQPEQNLNLQLIENHGAGFNLPFSALKNNQLQTCIQQILTEYNYKENMQKLQAWQASYDGPQNVALALRELAKGRA